MIDGTKILGACSSGNTHNHGFCCDSIRTSTDIARMQYLKKKNNVIFAIKGMAYDIGNSHLDLLDFLFYLDFSGFAKYRQHSDFE